MMSDTIFDARETIEQAMSRYEYMQPPSDYRRAVKAITYLMDRVTVAADSDDWRAVRELVAAIDGVRPEVAQGGGDAPAVSRGVP
jgi:hypothetical protein